MGVRTFCVVLLLGYSSPLRSQVSSFPYVERFDSVQIPALPSGWLTSTNRLAAGDFFTTTTSPRSAPSAVQSTNSTVPQTLVSPLLDFTGRVPNELHFFAARSGTHTSGLLVEGSVDGGSTWPIVLSDTVWNPGTTGYVETVLSLPPEFLGRDSCRIRWRVLGGQGGNSGTLRIDDILVTVHIGHDAGLTALSIIPPKPLAMDRTTLIATIRSFGILPASGYEVDVFVDDLLIQSSPGPDLLQGDTVQVGVSLPPLSPGEHRARALLRYPEDENASNDTIRTAWFVGYDPGSLIINEIMYEPLSGTSEWVEVYNPGPDPADLENWSVRDAPTPSGNRTITVIRAPVNVSPGGYGVIAADSSFFDRFPGADRAGTVVVNQSGGLGLGNEGDAVVLTDPEGTVIDSVFYWPTWHHAAIPEPRGRSLERIRPDLGSTDPRAWSTSADPLGGSPTARNSIFTPAQASPSALSFSPNPFSPDGDGHEDMCSIRFRLPSPGSIIFVRIFDLHGRLIRTLAQGEAAGTSGELFWDGMESPPRRARIGPHIVHLEALGSDGARVVLRGVIVVASRL